VIAVYVAIFFYASRLRADRQGNIPEGARPGLNPSQQQIHGARQPTWPKDFPANHGEIGVVLVPLKQIITTGRRLPFAGASTKRLRSRRPADSRVRGHRRDVPRRGRAGSKGC